MLPVAVVSGAASGIGRAVAERFLAGGFTVLGVDLDGPQLRSLADAHGGRLIPATADVRDRNAVEDAVAGLPAGSTITVCAAIAGVVRSAPFVEMTDHDRDLVLDVNLLGTWNLVRACLPSMRRGEGSRSVVVCASIQSVVGAPGLVAYTASKHALVGLVKALALECAPDGITVNAVSPAAVVTQIAPDAMTPAAVAAIRRTTPLARFSTPEEVAATFEFLCGDGARYITGANVVVDGGATAMNVHFLA